MKKPVRSLLVDDLTPEEAKKAAQGLLGKGGCIATPNGEIAARAEKTHEEREILNSMDLLIADGVSVVLAAKLQGDPLKGGKIAGVELGEALIAECAERGLPVCLLGGKDGIAQQAAANLRAKYPDLRVCGTHHGYFEDENAVVSAIRDENPALIAVCLGSPKQEHFMYDRRAELPGVTMIGLGGSLDVWAGHIRRAPAWMRRCGTEWLWRLLRQPKRIRRVLPILPYLCGALFKRRKKYES